jgi:asparagine synthase (glutamine-hydrolysing)
VTALAGYFSWSGRPDAARLCQRMLATQHIYGGRGGAIWRDGAAALGRDAHPASSRSPSMPLVGGEGRFVLAADVRLDNREDLAAALGITPPDDDEALLLAALLRWGDAAVERLIGEFAFAWWDVAERRLLLARDYLGQRPLHLVRHQDFVAFASMPKGLHALPGVARRPDVAAVADYLAFIPDCGPESFFAGIEKAPAGTLIHVDGAGSTCAAYWAPSRQSSAAKTETEAHEAVRHELDRATAARLRGRTRVAAQLSGGLDSSTVAATAARLLLPADGRVAAFTGVPDESVPDEGGGRILNESRLAALTAALHPNMDHETISAGAVMAVDTFDRTMRLYDRPAQNHINEPWIGAINDAAAARGLSLLLHGSMGNLSFSHSGMELLGDLFGRGRWLALAHHLRALRRQGGGWPSMVLETVGPFLPMPLWRAMARRRQGQLDLVRGSFLRPEFAATVSLAERMAERLPDPDARPVRDAFPVRVWALRRVDVGGFTKGILGGWGLQLADPTADRRLVELTLALPARFYMRPGEPRALARRAFADRLPAAVLQERRKGLQAADWGQALLAGRDRVVAEAEAIAACPAAEDVIDTQALLRSVHALPRAADGGQAPMLGFELHGLRALAAGHFIRRASEPGDQAAARR